MKIFQLMAIGWRLSKWYFNQWFFSQFRSWLGLIVLGLLTFFLTTNLTPVAIAQLPTAIAQNNPSASGGNIIYIPLKLDGRQLLQIAAEAGNGVSSSGESPLAIRVKMYENNLYRFLDTNFDPDTFSLNVTTIEAETAIVVNDDPQQIIMKVSPLDARIHGISETDLANQFAEIIQAALIQAKLERQSDYLVRQTFISGVIILGAIAGSSLLIYGQKKAIKQWQDLQPEDLPAPDRSQSPEAEAEDIDPAETIDSIQQEINFQRQRDINAFKRLLLQIGHLVIWLSSIAWILGQFPWTRSIQIFVTAKLMVLMILVATNLGIKGSNVLIDRLLDRWQQRQPVAGTISQRRILRISTFSQVLKGIVTFAIAGIGILAALHKLHIPIGPILAGAGIFGFAISFGSQTLVRDVINGSLILLEDQYAIGDFIFIGDVGGQVEYMNLRITQIRSGGSGELITVPNSAISVVRNLSKEWSRINFEIEVEYNSDVTQVMQVMREVAEAMHADPDWSDRIIEPVNLLGVNDITHNGIRMVIWIKTQPAQQWSVAREYRQRLKLALDRYQIKIGIPQQTVWWQNSLPDAGAL